jgi:hypothetical protein
VIVGQQKERRDTCGCEFICDVHRDTEGALSKTCREFTKKCAAHQGTRASELYDVILEENRRKNLVTMRASKLAQAPIQWRFDAERTLEVRGAMDDDLKAAVAAQPRVRVVD